MFGSGILDLVIGLIFIYFIMSLISSAVREMAANALDLRYAHLRDWFKNIFKEDSSGEEIMSHHLIAGLTTKNKKPSYIPDNIFSTVVFDLFNSKWGKKANETFDFESLKESIKESDVLKDDLKRVLVQFADESDNISHFRIRVETWFNQAMSEAAGTYRQRTHAWLLLIAVGITMALNVDSIAVSKFLYENPEAREQLADQAVAYAEDPAVAQQVALLSDSLKTTNENVNADSILAKINNSREEIKAYKELLESSSLPIGWSGEGSFWQKFSNGFSLSRLFGWLMTALAVSMGAPFWFDLLNKLSNLRSSSKPPEEGTATAQAATNQNNANGES